MTPERVLAVIEIYRQKFIEMGVDTIYYSHDDPVDEQRSGLRHCNGMLDQMIGFVQQGRMDKVFRWLGFMQGVLWTYGIYTLTDLKNHNKP